MNPSADANDTYSFCVLQYETTMAARFTIAGLGNPGAEYEHTRHNAGRMIVEDLARRFEFEDFAPDKKSKSLVTSGRVGKQSVTLVLPETYMNKSGVSLGSYVKTKKDALSFIVIHDDLDLPLGRFKISFGKNSGGHRGVESVMKAVKTKDFIRVRVGISPSTPKGTLKKPTGDRVADFVIAKFKKPEEELFKKVSKKVREAVETVLSEGKERAMGAFN